MVICLERGADLHMAQLMPLPLTVSCFSKIQIGFTFLVPAYPGSPGQRAVKWVCVCVCITKTESTCFQIRYIVSAFESFVPRSPTGLHPLTLLGTSVRMPKTLPPPISTLLPLPMDCGLSRQAQNVAGSIKNCLKFHTDLHYNMLATAEYYILWYWRMMSGQVLE